MPVALLYLGILVAAFLLGVVMGLHTQRETPEGLASASRWLGVRAKLQEDAVFPTLPPVAVTLWDPAVRRAMLNVCLPLSSPLNL